MCSWAGIDVHAHAPMPCVQQGRSTCVPWHHVAIKAVCVIMSRMHMAIASCGLSSNEPLLVTRVTFCRYNVQYNVLQEAGKMVHADRDVRNNGAGCRRQGSARQGGPGLGAPAEGTWAGCGTSGGDAVWS